MDAGWDAGPPSSPNSSHGDGSRPGSALPPSTSIPAVPAIATDTNVESNVDDVPPFMSPPADVLPSEPNESTPAKNDDVPDAINQADDENLEGEQTTLLNNEEESFALAPVDASALKGCVSSR